MDILRQLRPSGKQTPDIYCGTQSQPRNNERSPQPCAFGQGPISVGLGQGYRSQKSRIEWEASTIRRANSTHCSSLSRSELARAHPSSDDAAERTLAAWRQRRRREAADGTPAPAYRQALAVLPGWRGTPRATADEARW